jgi:hypothetical protein
LLVGLGARVPIGCRNLRELAWKAGGSHNVTQSREPVHLQEISAPSMNNRNCLPCRRSRVRIPSAASKRPRFAGLFDWPAGKCVCVAAYPMCTGRAGRAGRRREGSYLQVLCGRSNHRRSGRGGRKVKGSSRVPACPEIRRSSVLLPSKRSTVALRSRRSSGESASRIPPVMLACPAGAEAGVC